MTMSERKRYWIVMIISIALNIGLKLLTFYPDWPIFLDCTGTVLAAIALEPAAGLLAGLVDNFVLAAVWNGPTSILYFTISAGFALLFGVYLVRNHQVRWRRLPLTLLLTTLCAGLSDTLVTYRMDGLKLQRWEERFQLYGLSAGMSRPAAFVFGIFVVQALDVAATAAVALLLYFLLPNSLMNRRKQNNE